MATQQEYDDILRYKTAAAGTVKKYREALALALALALSLALALYTNITDFLLGGELLPWGRSFCPRTGAPGGNNTLRAGAPRELLPWRRPCPVTPVHGSIIFFIFLTVIC